MFPPGVFIFLPVVFAFEKEIDLLRQHMVISSVLPVNFVSCDQSIVLVTTDQTPSNGWLQN